MARVGLGFKLKQFSLNPYLLFCNDSSISNIKLLLFKFYVTSYRRSTYMTVFYNMCVWPHALLFEYMDHNFLITVYHTVSNTKFYNIGSQ